MLDSESVVINNRVFITLFTVNYLFFKKIEIGLESIILQIFSLEKLYVVTFHLFNK